MRCLRTHLLPVLFVITTVQASAQRGEMSPEQRQAILDYKLTLPLANHLITAMDAMTKYLVARPDFKEVLSKSMKMTPAERRAQLESDPKATAILQQNELTAREYMTGVPALRMALAVASGLPSSPGLVASPSNLEFAKAHLAELKPKMDEADGMLARPRPQ